MREIKVETKLQIFDDESTFGKLEKQLFDETRKACLRAYAPYSNFFVGAGVLLKDGTIVTGNNQENAAFPSGLCAERVAIFQAGANHPTTPIAAVAITINYGGVDTEDIIFPCGACRQSMAEYEQRFNQNIKVYLLGKNNQVAVVESIGELLPFIFSGDVLKQKSVKE